MRARLRYAYAEERAGKWPVRALCHALDISESGYYRYRRNKDKPKRDELLSVAMKGILEEHPWNDNYGVQRMQLALAQQGIRAGIRRLTRLMREHGWLHERKRRPKGLTKADPATMKAENLINLDFSSERPFQKLLTDITQVQCADGKLYISPILDCFNGEILSLCMENNMRKELCIDTVKAAAGRFPIHGAVFHSDRGSQYTSDAFRETLAANGLLQSLSGVAHCYDNARMESFFATLKKELIYRIPAYRMPMNQVKALIFRYVFVYYNRLRVYTANPCGLPPEAYRLAALRPAA